MTAAQNETFRENETESIKEQFKNNVKQFSAYVIAFIVFLVITAIVVSLSTDLMFDTGFFKVPIKTPEALRTSEKTFSEECLTLSVTDVRSENDRVFIDLSAEYQNEYAADFSDRSFIMVKYSKSGQYRENIYYSSDTEKVIIELPNGKTQIDYSFEYFAPNEDIDNEEFIYCLRIDTKSSYGIIDIICNV